LVSTVTSGEILTMQSEDRLIHFSTELFHPPVELKKQVLQRLYYEFSQIALLGYDSSDFSLPNQARFYSRRGQKSHSVAAFLPDRVALVEEWVDIPLADFVDKVRLVGEQALTALGFPPYVAQVVTLRSTMGLTHYEDARVFLLEKVCQQSDSINHHFKRPIGVSGMRFVLPETPDHPGTLNIVIESFRFSQREIFVEVKGAFHNLSIGADSLQTAATHVNLVRDFIRRNIFGFLDAYDVAPE
jgi:hypothetical protein